MLIELKVKDTYSAGREWLRRQIAVDEAALPENYDRPLKKIKRGKSNPFQKLQARYGFAGTCLRYIAP